MEVPMCITHSKLNTQNSIFNTLSIYMLFHIQNVQCVAVLRCLYICHSISKMSIDILDME